MSKQQNRECNHPSRHIARMRGSRVRWQCDSCGHMDKWVKREQPINKPVKAVKRDVVVDNSTEPQDMEAMTVTELKALCKESGISGYSKMNKSELIERLAGVPA